MKKPIIVLLIATSCLSANGQFFSKKEKDELHPEKKIELKATLPEAQQKTVYIELCEAKAQAEAKAIKLHPVKIHQTPVKRKAVRKKKNQTKNTLFNLYKEELATKHEINEACLARIEAAGEKNKWPEKAGKPATE